MKKGALNIVMGGQCGSEAKGKAAAFLADKYDVKHFACNLSPNAGHTVIIGGNKYVTHHLPVGMMGAVDIRDIKVYLGPTSVINPQLLEHEVALISKHSGFDPDRQLLIDGRATIITQQHVETEVATMLSIGSTAQGVGEARAARIMRRDVKAKEVLNPAWLREDVGEIIRTILNEGETILYEMGQGFDLCIDHGIHPKYCTSRNCTPMQALADMGVPACMMGDTYAVIRPYPIRVNNRTGTSGPYPSNEITWEKVRERCGAPYAINEMTTTTKLERRVFEFSFEQVRRMVDICRPTYGVLQFANYIDWDVYGCERWEEMTEKVQEAIVDMEMETGLRIAYAGTGPEHNQMVDRGIDYLGNM